MIIYENQFIDLAKLIVLIGEKHKASPAGFMYLRYFTSQAKLPIEKIQDGLYTTEKEFSYCMDHIERLPKTTQKTVALAFSALKKRTRVQSYQSLIDQHIQKTEEQIGLKDAGIAELRQKIQAGKGDKLDQKQKKESLTSEKTVLNGQLHKLFIERAKFGATAQTVHINAKKHLKKIRKTELIDPEMLATFERAVIQREQLKARFFIENGYHSLVADAKVQKAFSEILRSAIQDSPTWWDCLCCWPKP